MKIKYLVLVGVILGNCVTLVARELRTPLTLQTTFGRAYVHYPVPRPVEDDTCWNFDVIGAGFTRATDVNFINKDSKTKEPLAGVWFGKTDFIGKEAFAPSSFVNTPGEAANPLLNFATISPRFDYNEKGAWFHFTADRAFCGGRWRVGTRVNLPFRYIKTSLDNCCNIEETLEDVRKLSLENVVNENGVEQPIENDYSYGYRLDFLASLKTTLNAPFADLVDFAQQKIAGHKINEINSNPVHVVYRADGSVPPAPCALRSAQVSGAATPIPVGSLTNLNSNGSGVFTATGDQNNSLRAKFDSSVDYIPLKNNQANQKTLWVVPTAQADPIVLANSATQIKTSVERIVNVIHTSQIEFFNDQGVSFDTQRTVGVGDLDWDFYLHREWCHECWGFFYLEGLAGVRFPTGKRVKDPKKLLAVAAGNNGHYEARVGLQGGWEPRDWINIKIDAEYSHVFNRNENVAAPFKGAIIKNIGPTVEAKVSWNYVVGNVDFTFLVPGCFQSGFDVGYNIYYKQKDKITVPATAVDFFGITQPLDAAVLEQRTKVIAHRLKAEAFHQGNAWELYGGWSTVVAGKNATRDTDWYLGLAVFF